MSPNFSQVFGSVSPSLTDPCVPEVARKKQHSRLVSGTEASHEEGWNGMGARERDPVVSFSWDGTLFLQENKYKV